MFAFSLQNWLKKKKKVSENFGEDNEKDIGEEQSFTCTAKFLDQGE